MPWIQFIFTFKYDRWLGFHHCLNQIFLSYSSYFSLVFVMTESEVAPSEIFAETLHVQNILGKASVTNMESNHIPENEFFEV